MTMSWHSLLLLLVWHTTQYSTSQDCECMHVHMQQQSPNYRSTQKHYDSIKYIN